MFKKKSQPKAKYQLKNWSEYNKALKQRGSIEFLFSEELEGNWPNQELTGKPGASQKYADVAIETVLSVMTLYRLPLRAIEGLIRSLFQLMGQKLPVPETLQ